MAILHRATLSPTKAELVESWLDRQPWGGNGEVEVIGSYRYDDPDGQVGIEAFLVERGGALLHVGLTWRDAALDGAESRLIGTTDHSVLGRRWAYEASADPVARTAYLAALAGTQHQAEIDVYDGDELVERRPNSVIVRVEGPAVVEELELASVLPRVVAGEPRSGPRLVASWAGSEAVVATGA